MKYIHYLYIGALAFLTACSSEERTVTTEVKGGETDNGIIQLSAGIVEDSRAAATRAGAEDNHANHLNLTNGTKLALRVSGIWLGKDPAEVVKTTTATVGGQTGTGNKHNALSCSPVLYWDDYGSADPANMSPFVGNGGREKGLTIYGAAVDGKETAPTVTNWTALTWSLESDQTEENEKPADKDLLISNNVKEGTGDGTYKFDQRASGKLLEFKHALSKITVNLTAGKGFVDKNSDSKADFEAYPSVWLTSNIGGQTTAAEWALTNGTVDVTTGGVTKDDNSKAIITMCRNTTSSTADKAVFEALVMPGSEFASDNATIAKINADGNIYYVTAAKIRTAINSSTHGTDGAYATEAGKNYIINVTVNKTEIEVTATVTNWTDVTAETVEPVININADFSAVSGAENLNKDEFSFYYSTDLNKGYGTKDNTTNYYSEGRRVKKESSEWKMGIGSGDSWTSTPLYWPNHNTHYQFRAVWPSTGVESGDQTYPRVASATHSEKEYQVIKVNNVAYSVNTFPSDLMIARPEVENASQNCGNNEPGHTKSNLYTQGICAREGNIPLNFRYMMSQVEVNLTTTDGDDKVNLANAKVELVNVYTAGDVTLGDREVITTGSTGVYTLNTVDGDGNANKRLSAIVPQTLTYNPNTPRSGSNVMFRITIYKGGSTTDIDDIYYADIEPIKKTDLSGKVAPNGKWESGVHYVYTLKVTKTEVKVTASLTDWTTVNASQEIWF